MQLLPLGSLASPKPLDADCEGGGAVAFDPLGGSPAAEFAACLQGLLTLLNAPTIDTANPLLPPEGASPPVLDEDDKQSDAWFGAVPLAPMPQAGTPIPKEAPGPPCEAEPIAFKAAVFEAPALATHPSMDSPISPPATADSESAPQQDLADKVAPVALVSTLPSNAPVKASLEPAAPVVPAHNVAAAPTAIPKPHQPLLQPSSGADVSQASASISQTPADIGPLEVSPSPTVPRFAEKSLLLPEPDEAIEQLATGESETPKDTVPASAENVKSESNSGQPRPAVSDQIKDAVVARAETLRHSGRTEIHMRLEPPELGTVRVHLVMSDEQVHARLVVHEETTRQLLESQLAALRQRLSESGIALGRFDVSRDGGGSRFADSGARHPFEPQGPGVPFVPRGLPKVLPREYSAVVGRGTIDVLA